MASRSSTAPSPPPIGHAPKPTTGTGGPSRPSWRCCMLRVPAARYQPVPLLRAPVPARHDGTGQSATQREPVVLRDSPSRFRLEFRGTSDARSSTDRDTRLRIAMPVAQAMRLWQLLGDHLTPEEKTGEAQF
jgi:hypothetical protein